jgi:hypothetical protein
MSDYDTDLLFWSERQADLLRRVAAGELVNDQVDWKNVAEEIESLGRSDRRELTNRVRVILTHLIKLQVSPATEPRPKWHETIIEQQAEIRTLLEDSPSLRPTVATIIGKELPAARAAAMASLAAYNDQARADPDTLDFTADRCSVRGCLNETLAESDDLSFRGAGSWESLKAKLHWSPGRAAISAARRC